jgi:dTDP-4-amino-4,6-dideoxygalactose transaminase
VEPSIVPLARPSFGDEEVEAVRRVLASGWVAGQGPLTQELEERWAARCGTSHAVAVSNCTAALHLALVALGVGPGDDVLVADYTFPATGHAVLYCGARPVFVDVRAATGTIDTDRLAASVTPATKGVIAVDTLGLPADYDELEQWCRRRELFLLEDAACSAGASYRGRPAGSFGDAACFSLHGRKGITCGEGGILTSNRPELAETARRLSSFGIDSARRRQQSAQTAVPVFGQTGFNYRLSEILVAIALVQLDRLDDIIRRRRLAVDRYRALLAGLPAIKLPTEPPDRTHAWQTFAVTVEDPLDRGALLAHLRRAGVECTIGTYASHLQPVYGRSTPCPVSAHLFRRHLALPMHAELSRKDVERVARAVWKAAGNERPE